MTKIEARHTQPADIRQIRDVLNQTGLFPAELLDEMLAPALAGQAAARWYSALVDGEVSGFCYAEPEEMTDRAWNLLAIAVLPEVQGNGLGSALVATLEQALQADGQRLLLVDTSGLPAFEGVRKFYLRLGFTEEARIRDFWAEGDDKVTFRKSLI